MNILEQVLLAINPEDIRRPIAFPWIDSAGRLVATDGKILLFAMPGHGLTPETIGRPESAGPPPKIECLLPPVEAWWEANPLAGTPLPALPAEPAWPEEPDDEEPCAECESTGEVEYFAKSSRRVYWLSCPVCHGVAREPEAHKLWRSDMAALGDRDFVEICGHTFGAELLRRIAGLPGLLTGGMTNKALCLRWDNGMGLLMPFVKRPEVMKHD